MNVDDKNGVPLKIGQIVLTPVGMVGRIIACFENCEDYLIVRYLHIDLIHKFPPSSLEIVDDDQVMLRLLEQLDVW